MKSPLYEQTLNNQGVKWHYLPSLDLSAIDVERSIRNQARLSMPIDDELVAQYAQQDKDGSEAPAIVTYETKSKKRTWVIIDGNQRVAAKKKVGRKTTDAYVVESDDEMVLNRLTWTFNNHVNGKRLNLEDAMEHAKTFVRMYGMSIDAAAKEWGLNKHTLGNAVRGARLRDTLHKNGMTLGAHMTDDNVRRLSVLENKGEDVLVKMAEIINFSGVNHDLYEPVIRDIQAAPTSKERMEIIQKFGSSEVVQGKRAETRNGKIKARSVPPRDQLMRLVKDALRLCENYADKKALRPMGATFKEDRESVVDLIDQLTLVFGLGARRKAEVG